MSELQRKSELERYRLPVKFEGDFTIHPVNDIPPGDLVSEVEERWVHKRSIGKGAFGEVSLQEEQGGGELRAVKRLAQVSQGVDFSRELVSLASLIDHHQFFVQFYGWYEDMAGEFVYMAMEYVEGGDLSRYLADPIIRLEAREITKQLLQGLAIMHERKICHRDIKPKNVLVVSLKPMWIKIADFGISKLEKDTELRTAAGTLAYSAPEIYGLLPRRLKPRNVYTNAVDMWSLGCVVHEILTSERPFLREALLADDDDFGTTMQFDTASSEPEADIDKIIAYCRDLQDFPEDALEKSGVTASERSFVKALLFPDPRLRLSAVNALASPWMTGESASRSIKSLTPMPGTSKRLSRCVERNSLEQFYPEINEQLSARAVVLATELIKRGCPRGIAAALELLVLYDVALLISTLFREIPELRDSMIYDQGGERIRILQGLLTAIASIYTLARERGVMSARFLNAPKGKKNVTTQTVKTVIEGHDYAGVTRVGTGLKKKILDEYVLGREMKAPLLVIFIGDQPIEGEPSTLLEDVLKNCLRDTKIEGGLSKGPHSTAFQFVRIGDNSDGVEMLQRLTGDFELKGHVHFRRVHEFDHDRGSKAYWIEITKVLLGAIADNWD